jgi:hypothetical protein
MFSVIFEPVGNFESFKTELKFSVACVRFTVSFVNKVSLTEKLNFSSYSPQDVIRVKDVSFM